VNAFDVLPEYIRTSRNAGRAQHHMNRVLTHGGVAGLVLTGRHEAPVIVMQYRRKVSLLLRDRVTAEIKAMERARRAYSDALAPKRPGSGASDA